MRDLKPLWLLLLVAVITVGCSDGGGTDAAMDAITVDAPPTDAPPTDAPPTDAPPTDAPSDAPPADATDVCATWVASVENAYAEIRSCTDASQCGQDIPLGCGCTRNPVARLDADVDAFRALLADRPTAADGSPCPDPDVPQGSTCDCPPADGYLCTDGACEWNLT